MTLVLEMFQGLFKTWQDMFALVMELLPKFIILILWIIAGIIVLPCVFVAGTFYPKWTEWGEKL
jgi:hypothetical protein